LSADIGAGPGEAVQALPCFRDEIAAIELLEAACWPNGPVCPHCRVVGRAYALQGRTTRLGLKKCGGCRKQFTVKVGTPFESAHIALHKQLLALFLYAQRPRGVSAQELQRALGISYKSAWSLGKRLREARGEGRLPEINPAHAIDHVQADLIRVCQIYSGQFQLTLHTRHRQTTEPWHTNNVSGGYAPNTTQGSAQSAGKSGSGLKFGWVRETRVLAPEAAALDIGEEDRARAHVYALLGALLARAPLPALLAQLVMIQGDDSPLGRSFAALAAAARDTTPSAALDEYNALFIGLTQGEVTPYASYYLTGFLHEKPLARLRDDMFRLGIGVSDGLSEPEDHIGALCEMMAGQIEGRFGAPVSLDEQRRFFERHIAPWAGKFFDDLAAAKSARLYMPVGAIGRMFIDIEAEAFAMG
jgi:TorA maturation chaperone TorD/transposase-like protein